ncbi:VOC family protein [Kiloniella laminariae]|uniref:VOC family protein n=1 Tax=Kiloniella laminariae TaxID=454162 RepID=UPI0003792971|nr:VOC family protein [Kiloniella laminariae]
MVVEESAQDFIVEEESMLFADTLQGIDHLLLGVAQLEEARHAYLRLGFQLTPRGKHIGWGTANYCVMFPDDYLELLGIVDPEQDTNGLDQFLKRGQGGLGVSFCGEALATTAELLTQQAVAVDGPHILKRILELESGDVMPRFELLRYGQEVTAGISSFICHHKTPEIVWQKQWLVHPNGAQGIRRVVYVMPDPGEVIERYAQFFGEDAVIVSDGFLEIQIQGANQVIRIIAEEDLDRFYPGMEAQNRDRDLYMAAIHLWCADIKTTEAYFDHYRVAYRKEGDQRLRLDKKDACGVVLAFDVR